MYIYIFLILLKKKILYYKLIMNIKTLTDNHPKANNKKI